MTFLKYVTNHNTSLNLSTVNAPEPSLIMAALKFSKKKIRTILFRVFLILVLLEIGLRISGFGLLALQRSENRILNETENVYRILALGDSLTANLPNGQSPWPDELEIVLNNKSNNVKFKVFNEGITSATSADIASNLENNLDKYNPDMVIAMIGAQDEELYVKHSSTFLGKIYQNLKELRVYKLIKYAIEDLKDNIEKRRSKATEKELKKEEEEEEENLRKAVEMNPQNPFVLLDLGRFYVTSKNYTKLLELSKKMLALAPNDKLPFLFLGDAYANLDRYEEAEEAYLKAIEIDPNYESGYALLGNLYNELNKSREAIQMYKKYLNISNKYDEDINIKLVKLYMNISDYYTAYEILKVVLYVNPKKGDEAYLFGQIYEELNKSNEAMELFRGIVEKNPFNYQAHNELAWFYLNNNKLEEAEKIFSELMEIDPHHLVDVYDNIGNRYKKKGQLEKAYYMLNKASKLRQEMFNKDQERRRSYYNPATQQNYLKLYRTLSERGIKLMAMQYPTYDANELKNMFTGDEEIIFVSNEINFKNALENSAYEEYFVDRTYTYFGHPTTKGHRLIAENLAGEILKELNN